MKIYSPRLQVEIAPPGAIYRGSRYDWSGFVTQVILDNCHTFCMAEPLIPDTGEPDDGGQGLCNEFGIFTPLGYDDAAPGELFPKLGVGLLKRPDDAEYQFIRPYAIEPFSMRMTAADNAVHVRIESVPCFGIAALLEKIIRVHENYLTITYRLQNVGSKSLHTEEYAHNYLSIDGLTAGPDYTLTLPTKIGELLLADQKIKAEKGILPLLEAPGLAELGQEMRLTRALTEAAYLRARSSHLGGDPLAPADSWWQLTNRTCRAGVRETSDFHWGNFAFYATARCLCPEVFIHLNSMPGEVQTWSRSYTFLREQNSRDAAEF